MLKSYWCQVILRETLEAFTLTDPLLYFLTFWASLDTLPTYCARMLMSSYLKCFCLFLKTMPSILRSGCRSKVHRCFGLNLRLRLTCWASCWQINTHTPLVCFTLKQTQHCTYVCLREHILQYSNRVSLSRDGQYCDLLPHTLGTTEVLEFQGMTQQ